MDDKYISLYTHEAETARLERIIKRLWILAIIIFAALIVTNGAWIYYESQWEVVEETTTTEEYVHSSRDREILKDRYINGMCYEPLSEKYDVSVTTIKNVIYKNENRIFKHLRV